MSRTTVKSQKQTEENDSRQIPNLNITSLSGKQNNIFEEIANHRIKLLRFANKLAKNLDKAEDITSNAIIKAMLNIDKFNGTNLLGWLHTIVYREFCNYGRVNREVTLDEFGQTLLENKADPEFFLKSNSELSELIFFQAQSIIEKLPENLKNTFECYLECFYENFGEKRCIYSETKDMYNSKHNESIALGTVKSRINRARKFIKQKLKSEGISESDLIILEKNN
jgi:RNA polymerase sigma factor (sigma-70 family)